MTGKQLQPLIKKYLIPHLSGYTVKGRLLWKQPLDLYF